MRPLTLALSVCLVIAALAGAAYLLLVKAPADAIRNYGKVAEEVVDNIAARLHYRPTVTINEKTEFYRNREVLELALIEGTIVQEDKWQQEWLGSTKEITLRGTYRVKIGFSLDSRFSVNLDSARKVATVHLPPPRVLSVEQVEVTVREEEGWWNKLTPSDREASLNELQRTARLQASQDGETLAKTVEAMKQRLAGFLGSSGWSVEYEGAALPSPTPAL